MIGALRYQIALLAETRVIDAGGGAVSGWMVADTVWAGVERLASARDVAGERDARLARIAATVRPNTGFALGARVRFEGVDFEIASIESADEKERRLILICEEAPS